MSQYPVRDMLDQIQMLAEGARHFGLELSTEDLTRFSCYLDGIQQWSKIVNLVSQSDPATVIRKHILDSLAITTLIPAQGRFLDLGSGAGFPGLVVALVGPARQVVLIEARRKRANFLKDVVRMIKATNVRVCEGRVEAFSAKTWLQTSFEVVMTRATWRLTEFLPRAIPFMANGGMALAMKGTSAEAELHEVESTLSTLGLCLQNRQVYRLPFSAENHEAILFAKPVSRDT